MFDFGRRIALAVAVLGFAPVQAAAAVRPGATGDKFGAVFSDAAPHMKLVLALLLLAAVAALVLEIANVIRSQRQGRALLGLRFLGALRIGAPLLAMAFVAGNAGNAFVGMVYEGRVPPLLVVAPGLAEICYLLFAGTLAATAAVFAHAHGRALEERRTRAAAAEQ